MELITTCRDEMYQFEIWYKREFGRESEECYEDCGFVPDVRGDSGFDGYGVAGVGDGDVGVCYLKGWKSGAEMGGDVLWLREWEHCEEES